jgi:serine/threonine-protein kinase
MATASIADLVRQLTDAQLLDTHQGQELPTLQASFADPRGLVEELIRRGWLTSYQAGQVVQGRAADLVRGPYILLDKLGEGGMGQVYKARHRFLKRPVALKFLNVTCLGSPSATERFLQEMHLAARLDHPNIVRAVDAGQAGDDYYLAMELLEGVTLTGLVRRQGPLSVGRACACVVEAARGLQHAHGHGLIHRDVKPSNIMVTSPPRGRPGR